MNSELQEQGRQLGLWESICALTYDLHHGTFNTCICINLQGSLNFDLLSRALNKLFLKHPLLHATINLKEDGYYYLHLNAEFNNIPIEQKVLQKENAATYLDYFAQGVNKNLQPELYLWKTLLLTVAETEDHYLLISFHHSIIDGISQRTFINDLLSFYKELALGNDAPVTPLTLLPSIEKMLPGRVTWQKYNANMKEVIQKYGPVLLLPYSKPFSSPEQIETKVILCDIEESLTQKLIAKCHQDRIKVHSILSAALFLAAEKVEETVNGMSIYHAINLRKLAIPQVSDENIGCFVDAVLTIHQHFPLNLSLLARIIEHQLIENRALIGIPPPNFDMAMLRKQAQHYNDTVSAHQYFSFGLCISNWGQVTFKEQFGSLKLLSIHRSTGLEAGYYPTSLHIATINNQIQGAFSYAEPFFSQQRAEDYASEFHTIISEWAQ